MRYLTAGLLLAWAGLAQAQLISDIDVEGNDKTRKGVITQEMVLRVGDKYDAEAVEKSRQAIMDLGLFRRVNIVSEPDGNNIRLIVRLKEKEHSWYILPRIDRNSDGDITLGVNWRASNLNGLNQTSRLTVSHKNYHDASVDDEYRFKWKFSYPRIVGTRNAGFLNLDLSQSELDEERDGLQGDYEQRKYVFGVGMGRWFSPSGISRGLYGSLGLEFQRWEFDHLSGYSGFYEDVNQLALTGEVSYRDVRDLLYSRSGFSTGLALEQANETLGSDRPYFHQYAWYRRYIPVTRREHTNFNFQVQMAHGNKSIFGDPIYELSGGKALRGYSREVLEGDSYFLVNTEFLTPIFGQDSLRAGVLFDFGNVYDSFSEIADLEFESGVGFALRWIPKQWVDVEIRLDVAKGLGDEGETKVYLGTDAFF